MDNIATKRQIKSILDEMYLKAQDPRNWKKDKILKKRKEKMKLVSKQYGL